MEKILGLRFTMDREQNIGRSGIAPEMSDVSLSRSSSTSEESDSNDSRLYETCNAIIGGIDSALDEDTGWAREDETTSARLREVALRLKHWKNSAHWCASTRDKKQNEAEGELQMYKLLRRDDPALLKTIQTYMDGVSGNLNDIRAFFTSKDERSDKMSE